MSWKLSRTVLKSSQGGDSLADFNGCRLRPASGRRSIVSGAPSLLWTRQHPRLPPSPSPAWCSSRARSPPVTGATGALRAQSSVPSPRRSTGVRSQARKTGVGASRRGWWDGTGALIRGWGVLADPQARVTVTTLQLASLDIALAARGHAVRRREAHESGSRWRVRSRRNRGVGMVGLPVQRDG